MIRLMHQELLYYNITQFKQQTANVPTTCVPEQVHVTLPYSMTFHGEFRSFKHQQTGEQK